jgi:hypothetical protein
VRTSNPTYIVLVADFVGRYYLDDRHRRKERIYQEDLDLFKIGPRNRLL